MLKINDRINLLTRDDLIKGLGIGKDKIIEWENKGLLPIKMGRKHLYYSSEVHDFIKENDENYKKRKGR